MTPPEVIKHRWMALTIKMRWVIMHVHQTNRLMLLLSLQTAEPTQEDPKIGKKVYKSFFQEVSNSKASVDRGPPLTRVIGGEIVGLFRGVSKDSKREAVENPES